jgi:hypothetical protein
MSREQLNSQLEHYFPSLDKEEISILTEDLSEHPFKNW